MVLGVPILKHFRVLAYYKNAAKMGYEILTYADRVLLNRVGL